MPTRAGSWARRCTPCASRPEPSTLDLPTSPSCAARSSCATTPGFEAARVDRIFNRRLPDRQPGGGAAGGRPSERRRARRPAGPRARLAGRGPLRRPQLGAVVGPRRRAGHRPRRARASWRTTTPPASSPPRRPCRAAPSWRRTSPSAGRFFPGGHCPTVGIGGFLLQGGQGWNCPRLGLGRGVRRGDRRRDRGRASWSAPTPSRTPTSTGPPAAPARGSSAWSPASTCGRCRRPRTSPRPCTPTPSTTSTR